MTHVDGAMPQHHNVVACLGGERTALEQRPAPRPGPGELLLGLRVAGFCGTDLFKLKNGTAAKGSVLGHEIVGSVIAVGGGVEEFAPGDRVVVPHHVPCGTCVFCTRGSETMCETFRENLMEPGGFADTVLIRRRAAMRAAFKVPDHVSDEAAVFMEPAACVLRGVRRSGLNAAGTAVVLGAGSMGLLHLLVLHAALPGVRVIVCDPATGRLEVARSLGADDATAPGGDLSAAVHAITEGAGADAVFDAVGGDTTLASGIALTRPGGSVVLFAHAPPGVQAGFDINELFKSERRVIGTYSGALAEQREIFEMLVAGAFDPSPLVTHTMPLDDFEHGMALVVQQKALKVLFTPSRTATL
jgi:L-iditol 2-dehydrogenase